MKRAVTAVVAAGAVATPVAQAAAAKRIVTSTKTVKGTQAQVDRWGLIQVTLVVKKTTTTVGAKKRVTRKITGVHVPVYPNHTDPSVFINEQAIPMLVQEVLSA